MELGKDISLYVDEWTRTMLDIWREKVERLKIVRTGHFHESFESSIANTASGKTITMRFAEYGVYQSLGVGRGYDHGNAGDLEFLDPEYRRQNRLDRPRKVGPAWGGYMTSGKPRRRRDWFSKKFFMSMMAMQEDLARIAGEQAVVAICNALQDARSSI